jgi:hypothetical protein
MLYITIPATDCWDEAKEEFVTVKEQTLQLEHSLVSLSKWESKWGKSFLSNNDKTNEEILDYIRCMTITQNVKPETYNCMTSNNIEEIEKYIKAPMTATFFSNEKKGGGREIITDEVIYHWMIALNVPIQFEKWHLNRLIAQIKVCAIKSQPPKKMSKNAIMSRNAKLNAARRQKYNTKG